MARVTIEEKWWSDARRSMLVSLIKDEQRADGIMMKCWRLAQDHWCNGQLIPGSDFLNLIGCVEILKSNLAVLHESNDPDSPIIKLSIQKNRSHLVQVYGNTEHIPNTFEQTLNKIENGFIYVKGSKEFLSWGREIRQKRVDAGRKSALRRAELYGSSQPMAHNTIIKEVIPEHIPNTSRTPFEQIGTNPNSPVPVPVPVKENTYTRKKQTICRYTPAYEFIWDLYEKKGDKKSGFLEFVKLNLTTEEELEPLVRAIKLCKSNNPERKYRKDLCRFLKTDWRASLESLPYNTQSNGLVIDEVIT